MEYSSTERNRLKRQIAALAVSTGYGTFLIDPECQDIFWLDVPRAAFPLYLGGKWIAIKRHPLGRLFFSSDQPGVGRFTIDGLPGEHEGRCFFVFWRSDEDCFLRLIGIVRFINPEGREIAASSPFTSPPADEDASFDNVRNDERTPFHRVGLNEFDGRNGLVGLGSFPVIFKFDDPRPARSLCRHCGKPQAVSATSQKERKLHFRGFRHA